MLAKRSEHEKLVAAKKKADAEEAERRERELNIENQTKRAEIEKYEAETRRIENLVSLGSYSEIGMKADTRKKEDSEDSEEEEIHGRESFLDSKLKISERAEERAMTLEALAMEDEEEKKDDEDDEDEEDQDEGDEVNPEFLVENMPETMRRAFQTQDMEMLRKLEQGEDPDINNEDFWSWMDLAEEAGLIGENQDQGGEGGQGEGVYVEYEEDKEDDTVRKTVRFSENVRGPTDEDEDSDENDPDLNITWNEEDTSLLLYLFYERHNPTKVYLIPNILKDFKDEEVSEERSDEPRRRILVAPIF